MQDIKVVVDVCKQFGNKGFDATQSLARLSFSSPPVKTLEDIVEIGLDIILKTWNVQPNRTDVHSMAICQTNHKCCYADELWKLCESLFSIARLINTPVESGTPIDVGIIVEFLLTMSNHRKTCLTSNTTNLSCSLMSTCAEVLLTSLAGLLDHAVVDQSANVLQNVVFDDNIRFAALHSFVYRLILVLNEES